MHRRWGPCRVGFLSEKNARVHGLELGGHGSHVKRVSVDSAHVFGNDSEEAMGTVDLRMVTPCFVLSGLNDWRL